MMMARRNFISSAVAGVTLLASAREFSKGQVKSAAKSGYASVNGLRLYYEIHGNGEPLILLHGGLGSVEMFGPNVAAFAATRKVIAVELQGHGHTANISRLMSFEAMADDIAALIKELGLASTDVLGYSLGAAAALRTAVRHSNLVRKLVIVSTPFKHEGWYPEVRAAMAQMSPAAAEQMKQSPLYQTYARIAPRPEDWVSLVTRVGELIRKDYDWSSDVAAIKGPTMLVFGDADAIPPSHVAQFFEMLGGGNRDGGWDGSGMSHSRLAILPGTTHYVISASPALVAAVLPFLETLSPGAK
jgi:pimeloyl-ACP methyl ester carboxylesterase